MAARIRIGSLPISTSGDQFFELFSAYGEAIGAAAAVDRYTSQTKGFGVVRMADDAAARVAIGALDGSMPNGRAIRVNVAESRAERSDG